MSSVLKDLQLQYEARAALARIVPVAVAQTPLKRKATRTYTGAALARRQSWGRSWGAIVREHAKELT